MSILNKRIILIVISGLFFANAAFTKEEQFLDFGKFYEAVEKASDDKAADIGSKIFDQLERKYHTDAGFGALKAKMKASDFLANQMITQLKKATGQQMLTITGELFENNAKDKKKGFVSVAPAKSFYETSLEIFSKPINISHLENEEKKFLIKYYDLKLRILTSSIARAGQALAVAEPSFKGTYDYVLVPLLLHTSEERAVNVDVLPKWMRQSNQLNIFSDSCLLHYGFVRHAQAFAKQAAQLEQKDFSQENFYRAASQKCAKELPRIAVECLEKAIESINKEKIDERVELYFNIVQIWIDSKNFTLAAGAAKKIIDSFSSYKKYGNAIWLYYYALSKADNIDVILANIDTAISDPKCSDYKAKLMYIKWWALRRQKNQTAQIAAMEHQLITEYGNDELVAPIMLSQATDLLAGQDYVGAVVILNQLQEKFPSTKAAQQAKKIVEKLKNIPQSK